jgi:hypothetical protein
LEPVPWTTIIMTGCRAWLLPAQRNWTKLALRSVEEDAIMPIKRSWPLLWAAAFLAAIGLNLAHAAPLMIVGNDEKLLWDDNGKPIISPAGKDSVLIVDLAEPENPKIVANLPLKNSVVGPPVNVAIDPTNSVALVADSIDVTRDGDVLKMGPITRSMLLTSRPIRQSSPARSLSASSRRA